MSIIGAWPRSFWRMSIHRWPCFGIAAAYPGQSLPTYSSMVASVQSWQFVHSATSMIMFHFFMVSSELCILRRHPEVRPRPFEPGEPRRMIGPGCHPSRAAHSRGRLRMTIHASFCRYQLRLLQHALDFGFLLHGRKRRRDVLGAAVPQLDLNQRVGACERMRRLGL